MEEKKGLVDFLRTAVGCFKDLPRGHIISLAQHMQQVLLLNIMLGVSCAALHCAVLSCPVLSCPVLSCPVLQYVTILYRLFVCCAVYAVQYMLCCICCAAHAMLCMLCHPAHTTKAGCCILLYGFKGVLEELGKLFS